MLCILHFMPVRVLDVHVCVRVFSFRRCFEHCSNGRIFLRRVHLPTIFVSFWNVRSVIQFYTFQVQFTLYIAMLSFVVCSMYSIGVYFVMFNLYILQFANLTCIIYSYMASFAILTFDCGKTSMLHPNQESLTTSISKCCELRRYIINSTFILIRLNQIKSQATFKIKRTDKNVRTKNR